MKHRHSLTLVLIVALFALFLVPIWSMSSRGCGVYATRKTAIDPRHPRVCDFLRACGQAPDAATAIERIRTNEQLVDQWCPGAGNIAHFLAVQELTTVQSEILAYLLAAHPKVIVTPARSNIPDSDEFHFLPDCEQSKDRISPLQLAAFMGNLEFIAQAEPLISAMAPREIKTLECLADATGSDDAHAVFNRLRRSHEQGK